MPYTGDMRRNLLLFALLLLIMRGSAVSQSNKDRLQTLYIDAEKSQSAGKITEAESQYREFLASALAKIAIARASVGNEQAALQLTDAVSELVPEDANVWQDCAEAARLSDALPKAQQFAQKAVMMAPHSATAHLELGRIYLLQHASQDALQQLEAAVAIEANYTNGLALARAYLQLKDEKNAAQVFTEMRKSYGSKAAIHYDFGLAYAESGYPEQAMAEFKIAIAEDPKLPGAHYSLGASYLQLMGEIDFPKAEKEFQSELAINPNDYLSDSQLGYIALSRHDDAAAERYLLRAAALNPTDPDVQLSLGQLYVEQHKPQKALAALRSCIKNTRDITRNNYQVQRAHYLLGRTLLAEGDVAEAKNEMQISQQLLQMSTQKNQGKSTTDGMKNSMQYAENARPPRNNAAPGAVQQEKIYEQALSGPISDSYNNLGVIAAQGEQFDTALQYFQSAKAWNPAMDGVDLNIGRAAYASRHFEQAIPPLQSYLSLHSTNMNIRIMLAVCEFELKRYEAVSHTLNPVRNAIRDNQAVESMYEEAQRRAQAHAESQTQSPIEKK